MHPISDGLLNETQTSNMIAQKYWVNAELNISGILTIEAGANLEFAADQGLYVADPGSLSAIGSSSKRISFKGATPSAGFWKGIIINGNNPNNRLEFVDVMHGGLPDYGGLYLNGGTQMTIKDSSFTNNNAYGIYRQGASSNLIDLGGNTFANNPLGDIRNP
jgi:hypothetical protein